MLTDGKCYEECQHEYSESTRCSERFTARKYTPIRATNIPLRSFKGPTGFQERLLQAIRAAPPGKVTGKDDIFSEALALVSKISAQLVFQIWKKFCKLQWIPKAWQSAELVPLHKKGST